MLPKHRQVELLRTAMGVLDMMSDFLQRKIEIIEDPVHLDDTESMQDAIDELHADYLIDAKKMDEEYTGMTQEELDFVGKAIPAI